MEHLLVLCCYKTVEQFRLRCWTLQVEHSLAALVVRGATPEAAGDKFPRLDRKRKELRFKVCGRKFVPPGTFIKVCSPLRLDSAFSG